MTTYPTATTTKSNGPPASIDAKTGGMPSASTMTPIICTIVRARWNQSSVSKAEANQVKLIHAQQTESTTKTNPQTAVAMWPSAT